MTATHKATSEEIGKIVRDAIVFAHKDYKKLTGGYWLWTGHENYLSTIIAQQLFSRLRKEKYFAMVEYPLFNSAERKYVNAIIKQKPGKIPKELPGGGRIDCVLFDWDGYAAAVIEVKTNPNMPEVKKDINRLIKILSRATHRFPCIFACWEARGGKPAKNRLDIRVPKMNEVVDESIAKYNKGIQKKNKKKGLKQRKLNRRTFHTVRVDKEDAPDAYTAYAVVIEKN